MLSYREHLGPSRPQDVLGMVEGDRQKQVNRGDFPTPHNPADMTRLKGGKSLGPGHKTAFSVRTGRKKNKAEEVDQWDSPSSPCGPQWVSPRGPHARLSPQLRAWEQVRQGGCQQGRS